MKIRTEHQEDERGFLMFYQSRKAGHPNNRDRRFLTAIFRTKRIKMPYNYYMTLLEKHWKTW